MAIVQKRQWLRWLVPLETISAVSLSHPDFFYNPSLVRRQWRLLALYLKWKPHQEEVKLKTIVVFKIIKCLRCFLSQWHRQLRRKNACIPKRSWPWPTTVWPIMNLCHRLNFCQAYFSSDLPLKKRLSHVLTRLKIHHLTSIVKKFIG